MRTYANTVTNKFVTETNGTAGAGALVTVYTAGSTVKAPLFDVLGVAITNPLSADDEGNYAFKVADGIYDLVINEGALSETRIDRLQIAEIVGFNTDSAHYSDLATALAANLTVSTIITTAGYYATNDGGEGQYVVVGAGTGAVDGGSYLNMLNGNQLQLVIPASPVNVRLFGAKGDYSTNDTVSLDNWFAFLGNRHQGLLSRGMYGYTGSLDLPSGINITGEGATDLNTFITTSDKDNMRPGFKQQVSGSNIIFKGASSETYVTNRVDQFATIGYSLSYLHLDPGRLSNIGIIQDVDVLTAGGVLTTPANDNIANYEAGLILRSQLFNIENCNFFGYWNKTSIVIHSQQDLENVDSDYNRAFRTNFCSISVIGDETTNNGLTGFYALGCGFYSASDYHTPADGNYTIPAIYVDGDNGIAGIRGHKFDGNLRTKSNIAVSLDHCNDISLDFYTVEVPTLAGVANADAAGIIQGTANTNDIFIGYIAQSSTTGLGIYDLSTTIAGSLISLGGQDNKTVMVSNGGQAVKIGVNNVGDALIQLTDDPSSITSGWVILKDESASDNLSFKYNNSQVAFVDTTGNMSIDETFQAGDNVNVENSLIFTNAEADIRSASAADAVRFRQGNTTAFLVDAGAARPGTDNIQSAGTVSARYSEVFAGNGTINTSDAREKTKVSALTENEIKAAIELSKEIGGYKWLASVKEKGDGARYHIGMTVQRAIEIMKANSLDPMVYGFICYDEWDDETTGNRYGFRTDQLNMFILAGIEHRLTKAGI